MLVLEAIPFCLRKMMDEVVDLFIATANEKKLKIGMTFEENLPDVFIGDPFRLRQVLSNLIGNAIKYTAEGRIEIKVNRMESLEAGKPVLSFSVRDTGIGIEPDKMDMLFKRFTQVDSSFTRKYGGSGLGLAICKGLVERMGGDIRVDSRPGFGSCFDFDCVLDLPVQDEVPVAAEEEEMTVEEEVSEEQPLLLAEDDEVNRLIFREFARMKSWRVVTAENGQEAVSLFERMSFRAILMDIQMPVMDGFKATAAIRSLEKNRERRTPIIAITAHAMKEDREKCMAAGMDDYLAKPVYVQDFHAVVAKWL